MTGPIKLNDNCWLFVDYYPNNGKWQVSIVKNVHTDFSFNDTTHDEEITKMEKWQEDSLKFLKIRVEDYFKKKGLIK